MHFTYSENANKNELCQGDVLKRTSELNALLEKVHPHFHQKDDYRYFLVLTQSCDLVPRQGGRCKAPYITIAAVRPLTTVIRRQVELLRLSDIQAELPIVTDREKGKLNELLTRLLNNNEPGFFYLDASGTPLTEDCCAILGVSIALKSTEHYKTCLDAKLLQLNDTFQAKLGWLVGQMYSRVGTLDWPEDAIKQKVNSVISGTVITVPQDAKKALETEAKTRLDAGNSNSFTAKELEAFVTKLPKKKRLVLDRVGSVAKEVLEPVLLGQNPKDLQEVLGLVERRLSSDAVFTSLTK